MLGLVRHRADAPGHRDLDVDHHDFTVERETIEPGRTFSEAAMDALIHTITIWIGARIMRRWDDTGEPPSVATIRCEIEVR